MTDPTNDVLRDLRMHAELTRASFGSEKPPRSAELIILAVEEIERLLIENESLRKPPTPDNKVLDDLREAWSTYPESVRPMALVQLYQRAEWEIERLLRENEELKLSWENKHGHPKAT